LRRQTQKNAVIPVQAGMTAFGSVRGFARIAGGRLAENRDRVRGLRHTAYTVARGRLKNGFCFWLRRNPVLTSLKLRFQTAFLQ